MDAAYQQYSRLVEQVLNGRITEEREIERIMDGLVDFGDNPRLLELYKTLCRHVYYKYPALVGAAHCPSSGSSLRKRRMGTRILRR